MQRISLIRIKDNNNCAQFIVKHSGVSIPFWSSAIAELCLIYLILIRTRFFGVDSIEK